MIKLRKIDRYILEILKEGPMYNLHILDALNERFPKQRPIFKKYGVGEIFVSLNRLEKLGLVRSVWGEEVFPDIRRKIYQRVAA